MLSTAELYTILPGGWGMHTEMLDKAQAVAFAHEWMDRYLPEPRDDYAASQVRWLMGELAVRCVAETLRQGEDEKALEDRLLQAYRILNSLHISSMREDLRERMWGGKSKLTDADKERIADAKHIVWKRHDPKRAFNEGLDSDHAVAGMDKESLIGVTADYLQRPWLQHATLEWMLLDALLTREIVAFGEHIKEFQMEPKDEIGMNKRYLDARGNLKKMNEFRWKDFGERLLMRTFWGLIAPVVVIVGCAFLGFDEMAWKLTKGWLTIVGILLGWRVLRGVAKMFGIGHIVDPVSKSMKIWGTMVEVWETLKGPVLNPTMARAAMTKAKEAGAVWDQAAWSLIDNAVARDPAVWVIENHR